jgi:alpha-beta hydrolase superfamily lysophospholipase
MLAMPLGNKMYVETTDHVKIVGNFVLPDEDIMGACLLLHMMPATHVSFSAFQNVLAHAGVASYAIDLRGHGESILQTGNNTELEYHDFSDSDHQKSINDVIASYTHLIELTHITEEKTSIVGASIGANLALQFQASHPRIPFSVLLSPGLDYRGIETEPIIKNIIQNNQHTFLVASEEDSYSNETITTLHQLAPHHTTFRLLAGSEHGTAMFQDTHFMTEVIHNIVEYSNTPSS